MFDQNVLENQNTPFADTDSTSLYLLFTFCMNRCLHKVQAHHLLKSQTYSYILLPYEATFFCTYSFDKMGGKKGTEHFRYVHPQCAMKSIAEQGPSHEAFIPWLYLGQWVLDSDLDTDVPVLPSRTENRSREFQTMFPREGCCSLNVLFLYSSEGISPTI